VSDEIVLCGDLNLLPSSETFRLLAKHGMTDMVGEADTRTSRYTKQVRSASYLFVSSPGAVRSFEVVTAPEVSDHRALALDI
jgi:endonuclease/exonuclease/phosphatase family metal-dependent hydrolase